MQMKLFVKRTLNNQSGQALTEYVTLLMLVALGAVAITTKLGGSIQNAIKKSKHHIDANLTIEKAQHRD